MGAAGSVTDGPLSRRLQPCGERPISRIRSAKRTRCKECWGVSARRSMTSRRGCPGRAGLRKLVLAHPFRLKSHNEPPSSPKTTITANNCSVHSILSYSAPSLLRVCRVKSRDAQGQYAAHSDQLARPESDSGHVDIDLLAQRPGQLDQASRSERQNLADRQAALSQFGLEWKRQLAVVRELLFQGHWIIPQYSAVRTLLFDIEQHLAELVLGGDHFGVGLITALENDQVGEFLGQVYVGGFERTAQDLPAVTGLRQPDRGSQCVRAQLVVVVTDRNQRIRISDRGHSNLRDRDLFSAGESRHQGSTIGQRDAGKLRSLHAVLRGGRGRGSLGELGQQ